MSTKLYFRIATSLAGLENGNFFVLGLPEPVDADYNDHTTRRPQGGGGESRQGYNNAFVLWDRLDSQQANVLEDLILTAEVTGGQGNGTIYLTLVNTTAGSSGVAWIDISGVAIMPEWTPTPRTFGKAYDNVVLRLNDCTIEAEPSSVLS